MHERERFGIEYHRTSFGWAVTIWDRQEGRTVVYKKWSYGGRERAQRNAARIIARYDENYIKVAV